MSIELVEPQVRPDLQRHPSLNVLCERLELVIHGRAAKALLESEGAITDGLGAVFLPVWDWQLPLIDIGRKGNAFGTGEALLMPVRVDWTPGNLVLAGPESESLNFRASGMGHVYAGQTRLISSPTAASAIKGLTHAEANQPLFCGVSTVSQLRHTLRAAVAAGETAWWELVADLEPSAMKAIRKAHAAVSYEVSHHRGVVETLLDETGLEEALTTMMYGSEERSSSIIRLLELCLTPGRFDRVDPLRFISRHIRRDAEMQIRCKLGDPFIGPKIREVARQHLGKDISEVVSEYRKIYPRDRLSVNRAQAALSVSPDVMARSVHLSAETMRTEFSEAKGTAAQ